MLLWLPDARGPGIGFVFKSVTWVPPFKLGCLGFTTPTGYLLCWCVTWVCTAAASLSSSLSGDRNSWAVTEVQGVKAVGKRLLDLLAQVLMKLLVDQLQLVVSLRDKR